MRLSILTVLALLTVSMAIPTPKPADDEAAADAAVDDPELCCGTYRYLTRYAVRSFMSCDVNDD